MDTVHRAAFSRGSLLATPCQPSVLSIIDGQHANMTGDRFLFNSATAFSDSEKQLSCYNRIKGR